MRSHRDTAAPFLKNPPTAIILFIAVLGITFTLIGAAIAQDETEDKGVVANVLSRLLTTPTTVFPELPVGIFVESFNLQRLTARPRELFGSCGGIASGGGLSFKSSSFVEVTPPPTLKAGVGEGNTRCPC